ncbi:MAG: hypothetical protein HC780_14075 [Leptolyngbyaceae cyanobacterium CSU_1_3]|nr:hypothetical protein [Leptolyngbyaceae cyanobacterium CSU_1_3]
MQQETSYLQLEQDIHKLTRALATRNTRIGKEIITSLKAQHTLHDTASIVLISLDRLRQTDSLAFCWAVETTIPGYLMREIRRITSISLYKRLITKGFTPGHDFSMDAKGSVLLNDRAHTTILGSAQSRT